MQVTADFDRQVYDVQNVTASDYTVELDINNQMYEDYLVNQYAEG
jgi:hypothetical protein